MSYLMNLTLEVIYTKLLVLVLLLPLLMIFILLFINRENLLLLRRLSFIGSLLIFYVSLCFPYIMGYVLRNGANFSVMYEHQLRVRSEIGFGFLFGDSFELPGIFYIGLDGISVYFVVLSTFLISLCILVGWEQIKYRIRDYYILLFFLEFLLIGSFLVTDLFWFYIFFEGCLIPMFILIGVWGSKTGKIFASFKFFLYTFFGSILMLSAIIYIYVTLGSTDYFVIYKWSTFFSKYEQVLLWLAIFFAFSIKIPMIPVHTWLPEAHVEAPTVGSVLLAGILLKLGGYGYLRWLIPFFPYANSYFAPLVQTICIVSIIYGSLVAIRQVDLKRIIAYSSIPHMNVGILGLFSNTVSGIEGGILLMLSHGIIASALFICIGVLYDRYHTRVIFYYGGLAMVMPIFSIFFLIFILANMGFPGMANFVGEIMTLIGVFLDNSIVAVFAALGGIFGAIYSIWLYNRVFFGRMDTSYISYYADVNEREFFILFILVFLNFVIGLIPGFILELLHYPILGLIS